MNKPSPFSGLNLTAPSTAPALDQRLFARPATAASEPSLETTKQRDNETTFARDHETTLPRTSAPTHQRTKERASERGHRRSLERANAPTQSRSEQSRMLERHSHDIYQDQVRWLNRTKLDLEERYGVKVTGNAMVQLALDRLRRDFDRDRDASDLIRVLVLNEPLPADGEEGRP